MPVSTIVKTVGAQIKFRRAQELLQSALADILGRPEISDVTADSVIAALVAVRNGAVNLGEEVRRLEMPPSNVVPMGNRARKAPKKRMTEKRS